MMNPLRIKFARPQFKKELERKVEEYFSKKQKKLQDHPLMFSKAFLMLAWFFASYMLLVFFAGTFIEALLYALSLTFAIGGVVFNIQHDANHGAFSKRKWLNSIMGFTLDMCGGSSYMWNYKHNITHHTFTNIHNVDEDLDFGKLARMAPDQRAYWFHRFQHIYIWFLYGLTALRWQFVSDFKRLLVGITKWGAPMPRGWDMAFFWIGKGIFFGLAFVLPLLFHPWYWVVLFYFCIAFIFGLFAAIAFQLAHCVDEVDHPLPNEATNKMSDEWFVHQLKTTVNFAPENFFLTFYLGGLNFQVEHHLFSKISHIHYPNISPIIEKTCARFGIPYKFHPTFWGAITSHYRFLKRMGRPSVPA